MLIELYNTYCAYLNKKMERYGYIKKEIVLFVMHDLYNYFSSASKVLLPVLNFRVFFYALKRCCSIARVLSLHCYNFL